MLKIEEHGTHGSRPYRAKYLSLLKLCILCLKHFNLRLALMAARSAEADASAKAICSQKTCSRWIWKVF